jgi:hypothetical protein
MIVINVLGLCHGWRHLWCDLAVSWTKKIGRKEAAAGCPAVFLSSHRANERSPPPHAQTCALEWRQMFPSYARSSLEVSQWSKPVGTCLACSDQSPS